MQSRAYTALFIILTLAVALLASALWSGAPARYNRSARLRPSPLLAATFMETLCRPPTGVETVEWDSRPLDKSVLVKALRSSAEWPRVQQIRRLYFDVLRRDPTSDDCRRLREWIDRRIDLDAVRGEMAGLPEARRVAGVRRIFIEVVGRDPRGWDDAGLRRWVETPFGLADIRTRLREVRPLVGVHYFVWYRPDGGGWGNDATRVPVDSPQPALGWYDSADTDVMATQIREMEAAGLDFVAVHVIPFLPRTWSNAHTFFDRLSGHGLKAALVLDGLYDADPLTKAMWVEKVTAEFANSSHYLRLHGEPLVMLFSSHIDFDVHGVLLRNVYWTDRYLPGENTFNASHLLEPHDWAFWAPTPQPLTNGMVPVIPGYTDEALGRPRSMLHPRGNGRLYREQWQRALALRPEVILVYSWNEYFERSAIEPTDAWGDQYLRMTACFITAAHRGAAADC